MEQMFDGVADLAPEKLALLELLLQDQGLNPLHLLPISQRRESGPSPLSFAQQRLWFIDQLEPNNAFYNISVGLRLMGRLAHAAVEQSLSDVCRRHEALRTTFVVIDQEPMQVIGDAQSLQLPLVDLSRLPECRQDAQLNRLM